MPPRDQLSVKEIQVATHVWEGLTNREIADLIGTTEQVVKNYLRTAFDKLGVWSRRELALYILRTIEARAGLRQGNCQSNPRQLGRARRATWRTPGGRTQKPRNEWAKPGPTSPSSRPHRAPSVSRALPSQDRCSGTGGGPADWYGRFLIPSVRLRSGWTQIRGILRPPGTFKTLIDVRRNWQPANRTNRAASREKSANCCI
jgi:DNA-binding CsgD family transcriptional regulator